MEHFNIAAFERLRRVFDDARLVTLLDDYEAKCETIIVDMLCTYDDRAAVASGAHELWGMSSQFGFDKLSAVLKTVEIDEMDDEALLVVIADLCRILRHSLSEARTHLGSGGA